MSLEFEFTQFSVDKLEQLMGRLETCVRKLTPEQVWARGSENQNAIGNILLHLTGNVRQWILHGVAGEPDARVRDWEFSTREQASPADLLRNLRDSVTRIAVVLRSLSASELLEATTVQGYEGSKLAAIYHVVEHFAMHTGQVIFITKMLLGEDLGFYSHLSGGTAHPHGTP